MTFGEDCKTSQAMCELSLSHRWMPTIFAVFFVASEVFLLCFYFFLHILLGQFEFKNYDSWCLL